MVGGTRANIPPKRRNRSKLNFPVRPAKAMLGLGPLRVISITPQKNTPAKIIPAKTQTSFRVNLPTSSTIPPPIFDLAPLFPLGSTEGPRMGPCCSGGGVSGFCLFGLDIFRVLLTFRLYSIQDEEEHYAADWYQYEGHEIHEREHVYSPQASSDGGHNAQHHDQH